MGILYGENIYKYNKIKKVHFRKKYKKNKQLKVKFSRKASSRQITSDNISFLKSLGLKVLI